jgi:uncharacterized protein (TIGR03083 family)
MADRMAMAIEERRDFADFLDTLTDHQWTARTLCDGWDVRRVVAHVISYDDIGPLTLAATFARAAFRPGRVNDLRLQAVANQTPDELVDFLRDHLRPRGLTAGFGGGIGLSDCLIHHQDIRRPLGLPRVVPAERVREALDIALRAPVLPAKANAKGIRIRADDLDWTHGDGPEVSGPGESLLLALTGRAATLDALTGPGLDTLRRRVHR